MIIIRSSPCHLRSTFYLFVTIALALSLVALVDTFGQQSRLPRQLPTTQVGDRNNQSLEGKVYSLATNEGDIREVLLSFGRTVHLNIVVEPEVKGNVTVD